MMKFQIEIAEISFASNVNTCGLLNVKHNSVQTHTTQY